MMVEVNRKWDYDFDSGFSEIITATLWDNYGLFVEKYEIRMVKPSTLGVVLGYTPMWHYVEWPRHGCLLG